MVTTKHPRRLGALAALALALTTSGLSLAQRPPYEEGAEEGAEEEVPPEGEASSSDEGARGGEDAGEPAAASTPADSAPPAPEPAAAGEELPTIHHAPVAVATVAEPLVVRIDIEHPDRVKRALLVYRFGEEGFREVAFRWGEGGYMAVVPAEEVQAPGLVYAIELELGGDKRLAAFASRAEPHAVQVSEDGMDLIEDALAERLDGRRNVFFSSGEYVSFGTSTSKYLDQDGRPRVVNDSYYRIEGGYTHRLLRALNEFSFRVGVVRGQAPVGHELLPDQTEDERFDVGLNYGATSVRFRLGEIWFLDGSLLANVTEIGFSAGTGMALHIGDPYGSQVVLGFEAIQDFGARFFSQVDIRAHEQVRVSPIIEVTNMPSADEFGVRLLGELGVDIGAGFAAAARGGYQAREVTSGGPSAGGTVSYAF